MPTGDAISDAEGEWILQLLRSWARRSTLSFELCEDVVGDAVVWICRHRDRSRSVTVTWLRAVFQTFLRRARARWVRRQQGQIGGEPQLAGLLSVDFERSEGAVLRDALCRLPPTERMVVRLRLEGDSWRDALRRLGVPDGSHSMKIRRIRTTLRHLLP